MIGKIIIPVFKKSTVCVGEIMDIGDEVKTVVTGDVISFGMRLSEVIEENADFMTILIKENAIEYIVREDTIIPTERKVIIIQDTPESKTKSGLIVPFVAQKTQNTGVVLSVSTDVADIKKDDRISFGKLCGNQITHNDKTYISVNYDDIRFLFDDQKITPLGINIVVKQEDAKKISKSGIILNVLELEHQKPNIGHVLYKGINVSDVKIDQRVFFSMYAGITVDHGKEKYILMSENELFGSVDEGVEIEVGETENSDEMLQGLERILPSEA